MKKNFTINLYGELYNIDEDAYEALDKYLKSIARYFSREADGKEVLEDIEHRVAELLWERKQQQHNTVDIEAVREIIQKIGTPEQMAGEGGEDSGKTSGSMFDAAKEATKEAAEKIGPAAKEWGKSTINYVNSRRYYRSSTDCMIAGVCGGLTCYLGITDPIWCRLAFLLLTLFTHGFFLIVYLVMWMLTPKAVTPEDKLNMKGKDVNPQTLGEEVLNETMNRTPQPAPISTASGGCTVMAVGCLLSILVFIGLPLIACLLLPITAIGNQTSGMLFGIIGTISSGMDMMGTGFWGLSVAVLLFIGISIYGIICIVRPSARPTSKVLTIFLTLLWLISAVYFVYAIMLFVNGGWSMFYNLLIND